MMDIIYIDKCTIRYIMISIIVLERRRNMSEIKFSRQREAIQKELCGRKDHPTAEDLYAKIRVEHPNISLGTVYRNLHQLAENGKVLCIAMEGSPVRFDGNPMPHYHLACTACGRVMDVQMSVMQELDSGAAAATGGEIHTHSVLFTGLCADCISKHARK